MIKSDALHDGIAELEWGGDTGARACASAASSPPHPPASATTSASGGRPQRCGVPLSQLAAPSTETCVRYASGAQKDKRLCLRVALDPPQLSLTAPGRRRRLSPHWTVAHPRPLRCEQVSSVDLGCEMAYPPESLVHFEVRGGSGGAAAFRAEPDGALSAQQAAEELEFDYRFSLVHLALRSIRESDETCLKIDSQGARPEEGVRHEPR